MSEYRILDRQFNTDNYGRESYLENWPMLYILENGKTAYIGQSNHAITRMEQHKKNSEKKAEDFNRVHFIYSPRFNQSVTFDYEAKLIQCFLADEQYQITNRNGGLADVDYFNKISYDKEFSALWDALRRKHLAKKTLTEITDSDLFKYSPYKELNTDQREVVEKIVEMLSQSSRKVIVVDGMPGSGKTIVAIFLLKYLIDAEIDRADKDSGYSKKRIGLVIPQTSLRKTLKKIFKSICDLKPGDVIGPSEVKKHAYDILLVDEAHRLHQRKNISYMGAFDQTSRELGFSGKDVTELDWILKQSSSVVLFYDKDQVVGPSGISPIMVDKAINRSFPGRMRAYSRLLLRTEMRVQGGNDYIRYVHDLLYSKPEKYMNFSTQTNGSRPGDGKNRGYEFYLVSQFAKFEQMMYEKEKTEKLTRMVAGYAWPWNSKKDKAKKDIQIEGISRMWNSRTENWVNLPNAINEVGCIHSIQGYDLNYCFVIIGPDLYFNEETGKVCADASHYFDQNGKKTASQEELLEYIRHVYYVLMTRGIKGTYLYICDPALKKHFKQYIRTI